jgi:hypothetical protein
MARINIKHGILRAQTSGNQPAWLQQTGGGSYIDIVVAPTECEFTIQHFDENYLFAENVSVPQAWGPFVAGINYWLYWDVDFVTGEISRAFTLIEPVDAPIAPNSPAIDQHWFDTSQGVMKVWNGAVWVERLRLFAALYQQGAIVIYQPIGQSQVGQNNVEAFAGHPLFDEDNKPVKKFRRDRRGQFVTTETPLAAQWSRLANFRLENSIIPARAIENIPIYHCIAYFGPNRIGLAKNTDPDHPAIGISAEDMNTGEVRSFITKGFVRYAQWNWEVNPNGSEPAGTPVFVGEFGDITTDVPQDFSVQKIGVIVDRKTIYVDVQPLVEYNGIGNLVPLQMNKDDGNIIARGIDVGSTLRLEDLMDTNTNNANDRDILRYDLANDRWTAEAFPQIVQSLEDMDNVTITSPQPGNTLTYTSAGEWVNTPNTPATTLASLTDTSLISLINNQALIYDATQARWVNRTLPGMPPTGFGNVYGYVHFQSVPTQIWTIPHNGTTTNILVQIYDLSSTSVIPNNVTILDPDTVQVDFVSDQAGKAIVILFST